MSIDTSKIEHILRTKYGWDRFPLDEDVTKPKKKSAGLVTSSAG